MFSDLDMRIANAAYAERMEAHENGTRLAAYYQSCANWAANYGRGPVPVIPFAVDSSIDYDKQFSLVIFETDVPLTDKQPESFLPANFKATAGAAEIGAEFKHAQGNFAFVGTGSFPPDGEIRESNGVKFAFKRGFFGLQGYWVKA